MTIALQMGWTENYEDVDMESAGMIAVARAAEACATVLRAKAAERLGK